MKIKIDPDKNKAKALNGQYHISSNSKIIKDIIDELKEKIMSFSKT